MGQPKSIYEALGRHPVHPFPARMAPSIALNALSQSGSRRTLTVLDPMVGSGTVVAMARAHGHRAIGIDIDPLAVLITSAWVKSINRIKVRSKARRILRTAEKILAQLPLREAYPRNANEETRRFIRYWFDSQSRRQLTALSIAIHRMRDERVKTALWCAFSRLVIAKQAGVSLAKDLAHSRPHKSFRVSPIRPFPHFLSAVERVLDNCVSDSSRNRGPAPRIEIGDARHLKLANETVDLVLTSPPYLNAIDYMRCSKFSLVWMGYNADQARSVRARSIGTEVGQYEQSAHSEKVMNEFEFAFRLSKRQQAILRRFADDMRASLSEVFRVLAPKGKAIYVVGENTICGTYVRNSRVIAALAKEVGFRVKGQQSRCLPPNRRYLPPPLKRKRGGPINDRMRREVVLELVKAH